MDQQFSLSWNNFHGNLSKGFAGLLGNGEFVDVTLAVEGHLIQAHKVILSICSPYFKKMFQLNPCQHPIVVLRDVTHKAMKDLLQFMYNGEVSVKREDLTSFIGTAEVLQIKGLTNNNKETDEDDSEKEQETPKHSLQAQNNPVDGNHHVPDQIEPSNDIAAQNSSLQIIKQREFIEKLHRLSNLKRKSEEFLQKNYYTDILNADKRPKLKDKSTYNKIASHLLQANSFEGKRKVCDEGSGDSNVYNSETNNPNDLSKDMNENKDNVMSDNSFELKTECDDSDIIVTDPAVCTTPKSYDARDGQRDSSTPIDYSPQDNCSSLNSLFGDLKKIANGKVSTNILRPVSDDFLRNSAEHRLVTIPQKEDGKKKYPQRSCRLCWKIGRRRDTRFMCSACEMPFCKSPCFGIHYNDILKLSQLQGDYYAA